MTRIGPTSLDVAKLAGVSQITVSRTFSGKTFVSDTMRERVEKAASQLSYRPNPLASGLRGGRTRTIAAIWPFGSFANDQQIPLHVMEQGRKLGYATFLANLQGNLPHVLDLLDEYLNRQVDGLLFWCSAQHWDDPQLRERLEQFPATVVVTAREIVGLQADQLVHNRLDAICQVVRYLAATGRRRICMVAGVRSLGDQWKINAFRETCDQCELPSHPQAIIDANIGGQDKVVSKAMTGVLEQTFETKIDIDAILCLSDEGAMAAMRFFESRNLRVPEDVAVVGFNNTEVGTLWKPPLATVDRQFNKVVQAAQQMLFDRMERLTCVQQNHGDSATDSDLSPQCQRVAMQFLWRQSAGPAPVSDGQLLSGSCASG